MTKKTIEVTHSVDTDKLYGSLKTAIKYLSEVEKDHPDWELWEDWSGYEDMSMVFVEFRLETDEEYKQRLEHEKFLEKCRREEEKEKNEREKDVAEYEKLKRKLGIY